MKKYNIAVIGATGAVGLEMISALEDFKIPIKEIILLASQKSLGKTIEFKGQSINVLVLDENSFKNHHIDFALFAAGSSISEKFVPLATAEGIIVIDNSSHFRMQEDIPLIVPEVNKDDIVQYKRHNIIANPNCSTIQMVMALKPLDLAFDIKRVTVSTYQSVSGAGNKGMQELLKQMQAVLSFQINDAKKEVFQDIIATNIIPHIDTFFDNGFTKEELKMVGETRKLMNKSIEVAATCARVPVLRGHSEAISIECTKLVDLTKAKQVLKNASGITILDDTKDLIYPMPFYANGEDEVYVGRIRADLYNEKILHFWVVADNLRVGAATNAVRILKTFIKDFA